MNVGQLREDLAGIPGDLEVRVELNGRMVAAEGFHRYPRAVVLFESDPDEPHGGRPAGYIAPDESPADSRPAMLTPSNDHERDVAVAEDEIRYGA